MPVVTTGMIALLAGILASTAATGMWGQAWGGSNTNKHNEALKDEIRRRFPDATDDDIDNLINQYGEDAFNILNPNTWGDQTDTKGLTNFLDSWEAYRDKIGDLPEDIDYDSIMAKANSDIDTENAQLQALYDANNASINQTYDDVFNRQSLAYQNELDANNTAYNDFIRQTLSNDYMTQAAMRGSVRSEMNRSQRNAIIRGATAASQLVSNINTQLGMQNRAAQQSLDTSNALAQQLLNQRQAASGLRQNYTNALNQNAMNKANQMNAYTNQRANLMSGLAERKANYRNAMFGEAQQRYQSQMDAWNNRADAYFGDNASVVRHSAQRNKYGL